MRTRESEEMYLETILLLKQKKNNVRSVDVVEELDYAKSSVSRGVNLLVKNGFMFISSCLKALRLIVLFLPGRVPSIATAA